MIVLLLLLLLLLLRVRCLAAGLLLAYWVALDGFACSCVCCRLVALALLAARLLAGWAALDCFACCCLCCQRVVLPASTIAAAQGMLSCCSGCMDLVHCAECCKLLLLQATCPPYASVTLNAIYYVQQIVCRSGIQQPFSDQAASCIKPFTISCNSGAFMLQHVGCSSRCCTIVV